MLHYIHTLIMFRKLTLESIFEYMCQKWKNKHAHFKISSRDDVFTHLFFFSHPGTIFLPYLFDRDEFIPRWNFISVKTCEQWETFHHRQGWFHSGMKLVPGWNHPCLWCNISYCLRVFAAMKFHPGMKIRKKDV